MKVAKVLGIWLRVFSHATDERLKKDVGKV